MQTLVIHTRIRFAWHFIKLVYSTWLYLSKTASGMKNTIWHTDVSYISIMCPTFILAGPNLGSLHRGCFCRCVCENLCLSVFLKHLPNSAWHEEPGKSAGREESRGRSADASEREGWNQNRSTRLWKVQQRLKKRERGMKR